MKKGGQQVANILAVDDEKDILVLIQNICAAISIKFIH